MPDLPLSAMLQPTTTIKWGNLSISGPVGVVWEGSWRAHATGDVTSLSTISDSGVQGLLSSGQDGLARVWDGCGRLLGTLDPQPRFTAPRPDWETPLVTQEVVNLTINQAKAKALEETEAGIRNRGGDEGDSPLKDRKHGHGEDGDGNGNGDGGHHGKPKTHAEAVLAPLLAAVPSLYGPGRGTGYSFDRYSMTHVCTERVFDGRIVWVPLGVHVPVPDRPTMDEEEGEGGSASPTKGGPATAGAGSTKGKFKSSSNKRASAELGFIASGSDVPGNGTCASVFPPVDMGPAPAPEGRAWP
jgi:hypothetical protein